MIWAGNILRISPLPNRIPLAESCGSSIETYVVPLRESASARKGLRGLARVQCVSSPNVENNEASLKGVDINSMEYESTESKLPVKMKVFGPANDYSKEPWMNHYHRKNWFRKMFEKRVGVQEASLKAIQSRMVR